MYFGYTSLCEFQGQHTVAWCSPQALRMWDLWGPWGQSMLSPCLFQLRWCHQNEETAESGGGVQRRGICTEGAPSQLMSLKLLWPSSIQWCMAFPACINSDWWISASFVFACSGWGLIKLPQSSASPPHSSAWLCHFSYLFPCSLQHLPQSYLLLCSLPI